MVSDISILAGVDGGEALRGCLQLVPLVLDLLGWGFQHGARFRFPLVVCWPGLEKSYQERRWALPVQEQ